MSRIFVANWITVDGLFSGPADEPGRFTPDAAWQEENLENLHKADTILFGRITFKMMEAFWPAEGGRACSAVQQYINAAEKHVCSGTENRSNRQRNSFHEQLNKETAETTKEKAENEIVILGSGTVNRELHRLGLLDEYTLF